MTVFVWRQIPSDIFISIAAALSIPAVLDLTAGLQRRNSLPFWRVLDMVSVRAPWRDEESHWTSGLGSRSAIALELPALTGTELSLDSGVYPGCPIRNLMHVLAQKVAVSGTLSGVSSFHRHIYNVIFGFMRW
jgi:hypothetical protein